ncbi:MAG: DUF4102 domain-containing protein [Bradyrhizobium sp.]|nr:MAG: DUF4102 domain-containing protein [Bradyrhizobium sp.]
MAESGKLTALAVQKAKKRGYLGDGGGLYLQIGASGAKSWVFRFRQTDGRLREMGLGPVADVTLAEARAGAAAARKLRRERLDPIAERRAAKAKAENATSFKQAAAAFIDSRKAGWKNAKHVKQWSSTLEAYAYPAVGTAPVASITTEHILSVLKPIWINKPETAARVRGRIENILDYAIVRNWRQELNPARWKGHMSQLLAKRSSIQAIEHHAAMPFADVPAFISDLRKRNAGAALALEFAILTAAGTGEVIGAASNEIDSDALVWTIPAARMKARAEEDASQDGFVFAGTAPGRPMSNMSFLMLLRRMGKSEITTHGFRSSFRDWCRELTNFSRELAEAALAHVVGDKAELAYRRGDALEKRRPLMSAWADYCEPKPLAT